MPRDGDRGSTSAHAQHLAASGRPVVLGNEGLQSKAARERVFCMADQARSGLREAARLTHESCKRIHDVEQVGACVIQVNLVRRHEGTKAQGIPLDELHDRAIVLGGRMQGHVNALQASVGKTERLRPAREYLLD